MNTFKLNTIAKMWSNNEIVYYQNLLKQINERLKKYELKPRRYCFKGKAVMVETEDGKYVLKSKERNKNDVYQY